MRTAGSAESGYEYDKPARYQCEGLLLRAAHNRSEYALSARLRSRLSGTHH